MRRKNLLYVDIAEDIRKSILNGVYKVGELMPTENELEEKYQVSKITIRKEHKDSWEAPCLKRELHNRYY